MAPLWLSRVAAQIPSVLKLYIYMYVCCLYIILFYQPSDFVSVMLLLMLVVKNIQMMMMIIGTRISVYQYVKINKLIGRSIFSFNITHNHA